MPLQPLLIENWGHVTGPGFESRPDSIAHTIGPPANQVHDHCTRHANHRTLPHIRTESGRRRLCYRDVELLNTVGIEPVAGGFKADARTYLLLGSDVT